MKRAQSTTQADIRATAEAYFEAWGIAPTVSQIQQWFGLPKLDVKAHIADLQAAGKWPDPTKERI